MQHSDFNVNYQNLNTQSKILVALEKISQAFRVLLWNESKEFSLSPIQVQILIFLLYHNQKKRKVSYLAEEFNISKATVSDTIKTLEQKQLIAKETQPSDSRSYTISLTEKGKQLAEQTSVFAHHIKEPIDSLEPHAQENLLESLLGVIRHLNQKGIISVQRMCQNCRFYSHQDNTHFCNLLSQSIQTPQLRIDCPEHQPLLTK